MGKGLRRNTLNPISRKGTNLLETKSEEGAAEATGVRGMKKKPPNVPAERGDEA